MLAEGLESQAFDSTKSSCGISHILEPMKNSLWPAFLAAATITISGMAQPDPAQLQNMAARFTPVELRADTTQLSEGDRKALPKLIEAARVIDDIYLTQVWSGNHALLTKLRADTTPLGKARLHYFLLNKGPWSELDGNTAFLPGVPPRKPAGASFYPVHMSKEEFELWEKSLPADQQAQATGFFTVIRRNGGGKLTMVPYSQEYRRDLERAAALLREAAGLTENATLKRFLDSRADAFLSNDYFASDVAWLDLDAPLDITIGPYETYADALFGYKAAFEAYIYLRDEKESAKLRFFSEQLQEIENNLPEDPRFRNPKLAGLSPIRVVNEIFAAGDGAHGVRTAAYNLPNDERVVREKGTKQVLLKNVQEAKFRATLEPIARRVLPSTAQGEVSFDAFFTHILAHELCHGIGPHKVGPSTPRQQLKELYSAIEEAKADITGLFMLQYLFDRGKNPLGRGAAAERNVYMTYLASAFRSLRFGLHEAHGKGMALQFNFLTEKGAFMEKPDGTFTVDLAKAKTAARDLAHDLLTIEATGDYAGAKRMLAQYAVVKPGMQKALDGLKDIPTDIEPVYVSAGGR